MDAAPAVSLAWFLPPSLFESACEYVLGAGPVAQRVVVMVVRVVLTRVSEGENRFLWGPSTPGSWQVSGPSVFPSCISWLCGDGVAGVCVCVCLAAVTRVLCLLFHAPTLEFLAELFHGEVGNPKH